MEQIDPSKYAINDEKGQFHVETADGNVHTTDYLVLAAGVHTPIFAQQLGAARSCPTYPLRGYSLTIHVNNDPANEKDKKNQTSLLSRPFSIDQMYCTSVSPNMARLAGFGELVGYHKAATYIPSVGPRVLAR